MYFRVVSAEYMASSGATIYFVSRSADVSLATTFTTINAAYAETELELEECRPYIPAEDSST
jgi:hypothetical protein